MTHFWVVIYIRRLQTARVVANKLTIRESGGVLTLQYPAPKLGMLQQQAWHTDPRYLLNIA